MEGGEFMKSFKSFVQKILIQGASVILPVIAICFAVAPCSGKIFEEKLPDEFR